jgi:hypothetical protein
LIRQGAGAQHELVVVVGVVSAVGALLLLAYLLDRHARRYGHAPRDSAEMSRIARDGRRDARVIDGAPTLMGRLRWTEFRRRGRRGGSGGS